MHLCFGRTLLDTSTCTERETEFFRVLRGAACALQVRQLLLEMNTQMGGSAARGMVARWRWLQERTPKFHPRPRIDELLMMLSLRIGVGLMTGLGAEEHSTERVDCLNRGALLTSYLSECDGCPTVRTVVRGSTISCSNSFQGCWCPWQWVFVSTGLEKRCVACTPDSVVLVQSTKALQCWVWESCLRVICEQRCL